MPPERVLSINRVGFLGGVERVILTAAASVKPLGWSTTLACPAGDLAAEARRQGLSVEEVDVCSLSLAKLGRSTGAPLQTALQVGRVRQELHDLALATGASILHAHHPAVVLQAASTRARLGTPLIWHVHETAPMGLSYRVLASAVARHCDMFICVSRASRDMLRELGVPEQRTRLVYNAVDSSFRDSPKPAALPTEGPNVGIFGVLEPRKGHADLIRACAMLLRAWPRLQLWIVGGESFEHYGHSRAELEQLVESLGFGPHVHFTGRRSDVPSLMAGMDAVVSASVAAESLPTVLIEASMLGVPVLGTDVGGTREIICDGETGRLVAPRAPEKLAEGLATLLGPGGKTLARRSRAEAMLRFSGERFGADLAACYAELAHLAQERAQ